MTLTLTRDIVLPRDTNIDTCHTHWRKNVV